MTMLPLTIVRDRGIDINTLVVVKPVQALLEAHLTGGKGTLIIGSTIMTRGRQERAGTLDEKVGPPTDH